MLSRCINICINSDKYHTDILAIIAYYMLFNIRYYTKQVINRKYHCQDFCFFINVVNPIPFTIFIFDNSFTMIVIIQSDVESAREYSFTRKRCTIMPMVISRVRDRKAFPFSIIPAFNPFRDGVCYAINLTPTMQCIGGAKF